MPHTTNPKRMIVVYLVLVFALSSIFWFIISARPQWAIATGIIRYSVLLLMWCPAFAAIATRLVLQSNLEGFGWKIGGMEMRQIFTLRAALYHLFDI